MVTDPETTKTDPANQPSAESVLVDPDAAEVLENMKPYGEGSVDELPAKKTDGTESLEEITPLEDE